MPRNQRFRTLAVSLSTKGFGYAAMEGGNDLIAYGNKVIKGGKNQGSLIQIEKLIVRNHPNTLVLHDVNARGSRRARRIKELDQSVAILCKKYRLKVVRISKTKLRALLLGDELGTKYQMAEMLAKRFSDELASRLPPKRKKWKSEDARMDIFEAVALAVACQMNVTDTAAGGASNFAFVKAS